MILKKYSFQYVFEIILAILFLILFDQCTKIYISKIMLNANFENISLFSFLNIVLLEILE